MPNSEAAPKDGPNSGSSLSTITDNFGHRRAGSIFRDLPFVRSATPDQKRRFGRAMQEAKETAQWRRDQVLAHPDLAATMARAMGYSWSDKAGRKHLLPQLWNGYIPPRFYESGGDGEGERWLNNDSPFRAVLTELVAEAASRGEAAR